MSQFPEALGPPVVHAGGLRALCLGTDGEALLTVREAARRLRVSRSTVYALCAEGRLPHARVSNAIRISPDAVDFYLGQRRPRL